MNNHHAQTLSQPDLMEQQTKPVSYMDNTNQNARPYGQQPQPQQMGMVQNNLLQQIKEQVKSEEILNILKQNPRLQNGLTPLQNQNTSLNGKAMDQMRPDAQVQMLLNQLNNIQQTNYNGTQFSSNIPQNQNLMLPEKNRKELVSQNQQNESNTSYRLSLPPMGQIGNFTPQNGLQNPERLSFPVKSQVGCITSTLQNYKFSQNSNSNVYQKLKQVPEEKQNVQNNMQMNIQNLQALQQNFRQNEQSQVKQNQDQVKMNGDMNIMNRVENQQDNKQNFIPNTINQNTLLQQVVLKSQIKPDKKDLPQNNINQDNINLNVCNLQELFKMNPHMINMPQSKPLAGQHTHSTATTADTRTTGNSFHQMQNKNQIKTSFNGNLNFKQIPLEDVDNLLKQQQNNLDPQSSGQDCSNNNNHVQKWLEDNWATGSQFISQLQHMGNKNNQQAQQIQQIQQEVPQEAQCIEEVITQTNFIQNKIQGTLEKLKGMKQSNQEIRFNNNVFGQQFMQNNQDQSVRNMKNQFNSNINILMDLNQLQEENHKLLSQLFQQISDKSILGNPQQFLSNGNTGFNFNGNSPQQEPSPPLLQNKEQVMSSQIFMIVEKLKIFFKKNNSQSTEMNNEILQQLYKIHGTIQNLLQNQEENRNDQNPNQQGTVNQLSMLKNILDSMIREQVMHLNSIEKAPATNVNTSNGLIGFPQPDQNLNQFQGQQMFQQQMPSMQQQPQIIGQNQNIEPLVQKVQRLDQENRIQDNFQLFKQINQQNVQSLQKDFGNQQVMNSIQSNQNQKPQNWELMNLQRQIDDSDINNHSQEDKNNTSGNEVESKPITSDYSSSMNEQDAKFHKFFFPTDSEDKRESDLSPSSTVVNQVKHSKKKTQIQYVLQTLQIIRSVIREDEILFIKNKIEEVVKQNSEDLDKILIEANIPRKNHNSTESDTNFRGSKYRGPSKNRKKWQVMKMIKKQTVRVGTVETELEAARIYDFLAILTEGLNAKTNFDYNTKQLHAIIQEFFYNEKINEQIKYFEGEKSLTQTQNQSGTEENQTNLGKRNFSTFQNKNFGYVQNLQNNLRTLQQQNLTGSINQNLITQPKLNLANPTVSLNGQEASQPQFNQVKDEQKQIELLNYLNNQITQITNNTKQ